MEPLGDKIYNRIVNTIHNLFLQSEMAQLTYISFEQMVAFVKSYEKETIPISYPIGFRVDNTPIMSDPREYTKEELYDQYAHLGLNKLPIDSIFQLVTITETMLNDILRFILIQYPNKIPSKRKIDIDKVLKFESLEQTKLYIVDSVLNEIAYKSPKEYAQEFENYVGVNLLENPIFHKYIELKATRDIHIHNQGIANEIYRIKAGVSARVTTDIYLPVDITYFLQSYEVCLKICELLRDEIHNIWPSNLYAAKKQIGVTENKNEVVENVIDTIKNN